MSVVKVTDVAFVRFAAPDLEAMRSFLEDFGLSVAATGAEALFMRGHGPAPFLHATERGDAGFRALGLKVATIADLQRLADAEGACVEDLAAPGGGKVVRLADPDGHCVEVVAGQQAATAAAAPGVTPWNRFDAPLRLRQTRRTPAGAAHVMRLGHCVLNVTDFRVSEAWYKDRFGFLTSDEIGVGDDVSLGAFLRCDLGDAPTDHHSLFLMQHPRGPGFNHAAFEVLDLDDLMAGHARLKQTGRTPAWGVGRHLLGSQVFDYWRDPWGHMLEHWTDGDLFTAADGANRVGIPELLAVQWGPSAPPDL